MSDRNEGYGRTIAEYKSATKDFQGSGVALSQAQNEESKQKQKQLDEKRKALEKEAERMAQKAKLKASEATAKAESFERKLESVTPYVIGIIAAATIGIVALRRS